MSTSPKLSELEAEIARARAELVATVDALSTQLSPRYQATQAAERARLVVRDAVGSSPDATPHARLRARLVLGAGALGLGLVVVMVVRWRH